MKKFLFHVYCSIVLTFAGVVILSMTGCGFDEGVARGLSDQPKVQPTSRPLTKEEVGEVVGEKVGKVIKDTNSTVPGYGAAINAVLIILAGLYVDYKNSKRTSDQTGILKEKTDDQTKILKPTSGE